MNIYKHNKFQDLLSLQGELNQLFNSVFSSADGNTDQIMRGAWNPLVDIYETQNNIIVEAELPGMKPEDVEVSVENNTLTLRGERHFEKKADGNNFYRVERSYGSFSRSFTLPPTVTSENATAEFQNGLLKLTLAKREEAKPRRIEITSAEPETKQVTAKAQNV